MMNNNHILLKCVSLVVTYSAFNRLHCTRWIKTTKCIATACQVYKYNMLDIIEYEIE